LLEGCPIVPDRTGDPDRCAARAALAGPIPRRLLIAGGPYTGAVPTRRALAAIARGVVAAGMPEPDVLALHAAPPDGVRRALEDLGLPRRLRACRAVIVAAERLDPATLPGSPAFEIATAARQVGVPAYAIAAVSELGAFEERMLDLQIVLRAAGTRSLTSAGASVARLAGPPAPAPERGGRLSSGSRGTRT
jgi:hypothetical protein